MVTANVSEYSRIPGLVVENWELDMDLGPAKNVPGLLAYRCYVCANR